MGKCQSDVQLTDFAEEEEFESLVKELSTDVSAAEYIDFDRDVVTSQPSIDVKNIAWQQESRQNTIGTVMRCHNDQYHIMIRNRQQKKITDYFNKKNDFFFTIPHSHSQIRGRRSPCESGSSVKQLYLKFGNFLVQTSPRRTPL